MPAKKMAIRNWRIIDKKSAEIKKTSNNNTHLLIASLFMAHYLEKMFTP
jgi:hypothetical protein